MKIQIINKKKLIFSLLYLNLSYFCNYSPDKILEEKSFFFIYKKKKSY